MNKLVNKESTYFSVKSKLDVPIRTSRGYWNIIVKAKHPKIAKFEKEVKKTLENPDEIRFSKSDREIYLFYKKFGKRFVCVVCRLLTNYGYIVTAYLTDKIKEGEIKWKK